MHKRHTQGVSRREFLGGLALAGTAGLLGLKPELVVAEPPLETTTLRLARNDFDLCVAPQYVAEQILRDEGFQTTGHLHQVRFFYLALGTFDMEVSFSTMEISRNLIGRDFFNLVQVGFREKYLTFYLTPTP